MARGAEAKARRKEQRKQEQMTAHDLLNKGGSISHDFGPVEDNNNEENEKTTKSNDNDDTPEMKNEEFPQDLPPMPKQKKKTKEKEYSRSKKGLKAAAAVANSGGGSSGGIKTAPLLLLIMLTGTTVLPALIYASDYLGKFAQQHHLLGAIGYRLGVGSTPKKRVISFYEKHDPTKLEEVPQIMSKYYGDYPKLIKRLERKYGDYGYFLEWEQDEAPMKLALEQLQETRDYLGQQFNLHAPQPIKTAVRNVRYNVGKLVKKFKKVWKKHLWPALEPFFGVPKGAKQQKRQDAKEARERKRAAEASSGSGGGTRRKRNTDYRDDMEDEH